MQGKEIRISFYRQESTRDDWHYAIDQEALEHALTGLAEELAVFGIRLSHNRDESVTIRVNGYGDLLNAVRLHSLQDGFSNVCLGHVLGASPNRDLLEDLRRGVNRLAFAPETIEPEGSSKVVCHNCGCGC